MIAEDTAQAMNRNDNDALTEDDGHNERNRAGGNIGWTQPSLTTPQRLRRGPGDSELIPTRTTSRLRAHEPNDDDSTLTPSVITTNGERSILMPARRTETTLFKGDSGEQESHALHMNDATQKKQFQGGSSGDKLDVTHQGSFKHFIKDRQAHIGLELAPAREHGPQVGGVGRGAGAPAFFVAKEQHGDSRGRPAAASGNIDIDVSNSRRLGHPTLVEDGQQEIEMEETDAESPVQPGAYRVRGILTRDDGATAADTTWGGVDSSEQADVAEGEDHNDDLFSAQLVNPEAENVLLESQVERIVDERLAQRGSSGNACCIVAGVDFSKRTSQVICLLVLALAVASLFVALFATGVVGPQSSAAATSQSRSNPPDVSGSRPTAQPSRSPNAPTTPSPFPGPAATVSPNVQSTPRPVAGAPVPSAPIAPSTHPSVRVAQWVQVGEDIEGEALDDQSGRSVALSSDGSALAIGAPENDGGGTSAGQVRVYVNTGEVWDQRGSDLDGSRAADRLGSSLALSADGTILAVGALAADGINNIDSGRVQVYRWITSDWQPMGSAIDGEATDDLFGFSTALSDDGTILAVGAPENDAGGFGAGHVRVFAWTGTDWHQRGSDLEGSSPGDSFGDSVSLSSDGSIVACGADQTNNPGPGYVRVYRWTGSTLQQQGSTLMGFASNDDFGESVSLSGDGRVVAVGADYHNYAVIFQNDGTDWVQIGQTIRCEAFGAFGYSLSLSFDGRTVVIGGPYNDSNGSSSGHAFVYRLATNRQEWIQVGQELIGQGAENRFGVSTSISDDGTRLAIGADFNDGNGPRAGHVRVYDLQ